MAGFGESFIRLWMIVDRGVILAQLSAFPVTARWAQTLEKSRS